MCHVVHDEYNGGRVSCCTRRVQLLCVTLYTTSIVVVCHVVHDEYSGDRVSSCTLRVQLSCVMLYTASIGVVCRVSCCTRRI